MFGQIELAKNNGSSQPLTADTAEWTTESGSAELEVGLRKAQGSAPQLARQDLSASL
jgi:hypothetical protein